MNENEKYFVGSWADEPARLHFKLEDAVAQGYNYIDAFDENGLRVNAYKIISNEDGIVIPFQYTNNF